VRLVVDLEVYIDSEIVDGSVITLEDLDARHVVPLVVLLRAAPVAAFDTLNLGARAKWFLEISARCLHARAFDDPRDRCHE
jgi:hypothetical protein